MLTTVEKYGMSADRLLVVPNGFEYTTEEILLLGESNKVVFYDNREDMDYHVFERKNYLILEKVSMINGRIAVVLV